MDNDKNKPTNPITSKNEVGQSNDPKINQDVPGFPHKPSSKEELQQKNPTPKAHDTEVVNDTAEDENNV